MYRLWLLRTNFIDYTFDLQLLPIIFEEREIGMPGESRFSSH